MKLDNLGKIKLSFNFQKNFRSKEISKASVVDDMVESNPILYKNGEKPDHTIVIKYVPFVGDSKRAMDEYICSIFMGGHQTFVIHNTCEDSLLAAPLILDLTILTELFSRIKVKILFEIFYLYYFFSTLQKLQIINSKTFIQFCLF